MNANISIGVLARLTGCTVPTIRYYEEIDLLPAGPRTDAGRRVYGEAAVRQLTFIRRCRDFGFSLDQVRELVGLSGEHGRPCGEVRDIAATHLATVRQKLSELTALEAGLSALVLSCDAAGTSDGCTIIEDLASAARRSTGDVDRCCTPCPA